HASLLGMPGTDGVCRNDLIDVLDLHFFGHLEIERARRVGGRPQRAFGECRMSLAPTVAQLHDDAGAVFVHCGGDLVQAGNDLRQPRSRSPGTSCEVGWIWGNAIPIRPVPPMAR